MGFHVDDPKLDRLVAEVARMAGESEADAMIRSLELRRDLLMADHRARVEKAFKYLEEEVWPTIPPEIRGKPLTREEEDEILGYGPHGYCE